VQFLREHVEALEADDWSALAAELARVGYWEFEDYQE
jgi:Immunity protein 8